MRIILENTEQYIQALAASIGKDPASLESWRCIVIKPRAALSNQERQGRLTILEALQIENKEASCDIVVCTDEEILLIGRAVDLPTLQQVQIYLTGSEGEDEQHEIQTHDMFFGWRDIRNLLLSKVKVPQVLEEPETCEDLGDTASLQETFKSLKEQKSKRTIPYVLLVEDDEMTRRLVATMFKEQYHVITAANAKEALSKYLTNAPDIVFLDINLPDHDGFQVLKKILENDPEAYVVMFSGNSYIDNITHALTIGASGFVAKPFNGDKMRHYIDDCALANRKIY